jgi:hypothetical protein
MKLLLKDTEEIIVSLIQGISTMYEVQSVGISGNKTPLPKAGEGDIDIFIYCDTIPELEKRKIVVNKLGDLIQESKFNTFEGGHWGIGDYILINGVETWLMYFTINEALNNLEAILNGNYPDKLDNYYYPVGRCAMLQNINILYDKKDFLSIIKEKLSQYPDKLAEKLIQYHMDELQDTEDLERAVMRKDILFYHFAIDLAIDHFLQAIFAINRVYFPSRKRTLEFIDRFKLKPEKCSERLLEVISLGSSSEDIKHSYIVWRNLVDELKIISEK